MKLALNQLEQHLSKKLAALYIISSDEILLAQEALAMLRAAAAKAGFLERISLHAEPPVDWSKQLHAETNALSLFAPKRVIELHLGSTKPNAAATKILKEVITHLTPEIILIITTHKLDSKTEQSAWYKALDQAGVAITIWPITLEQLPQWILQRAKTLSLTMTPDAAKLLAEQVEGNLLAASQEIEKLALLQPNQIIDANAIANIITDNARFDIFNLVECALAGKGQRCLRILNNLEAEDGEPLLILWALTRELRTLSELAKQVRQGSPLTSLFSKYRIWEKRQPGVRRFLQQHSLESCLKLLSFSAYIDTLIKGAKRGNVWIALQQLSLTMAGNAIINLSTLMS